MSLDVVRCVFDETEEDTWRILKDEDYSRTLAGFERWRDEVYGSELAIKLGCTILPLLSKHDLYCYTEQAVVDLLADTRILLKNIDLLSSTSGYEQEFLEFRIRNIQNAALWALEHDGRVIVW